MLYPKKNIFRLVFSRLKKSPNSIFEPQTSTSGFTLLELLIVFVLIGILTGIGVAGFVSYNRRQAIEQAALDIKLGIEQAKQLAVSRVKPLTFSGSLDMYRITFCNTAASPTNCTASIGGSNNLYQIDAVDLAGNILNVSYKKRPTSVTLATSGACTDKLRFYILKSTDNVSCTITLSSTLDTNKKTICVDTGGNAVIHDGAYANCP